MANVRSRRWTWTLNNFTEIEEKSIQDSKCSYIVYEHEVGEEGTPHLQGYVEFKDAKTMSSVKKLLGSNRLHLQSSKGTPEENLAYCTKDVVAAEEQLLDPPFWYQRGEISVGQGKRMDIERLKECVKRGDMITVFEEDPLFVLKNAKGFDRVRDEYTTLNKRDYKPVVIWLWGDTGVGKTRLSKNYRAHKSVYEHNNTKWWDGYRQQECVVINDWRPYNDRESEYHFSQMLKLLDRTPHRIEYKGGSMEFNSPYIILNCERPPSFYFQVDERADFEYQQNRLAQLMRRIDLVIHVEDEYEMTRAYKEKYVDRMREFVPQPNQVDDWDNI